MWILNQPLEILKVLVRALTGYGRIENGAQLQSDFGCVIRARLEGDDAKS
jgi:hypothetical protein